MSKIPNRSTAQPNVYRQVAHSCIIAWVLLVCSACSGSPRPDPTIPIPALAEQVDRGSNIAKSVRFTTKSTPDQVLDWYKQEMTAQGWKVYIEARTTSPAAISFTSAGYRVLFVLDVIAERQPDGITAVQVELKPQLAA